MSHATQSPPQSVTVRLVEQFPRTVVVSVNATVVSFPKKQLDDNDSQYVGESFDQIISLVKSGHRNLVLDLRGVEYIGEVAVAKLITLRIEVDAADGRLVLCGMCRDVMERFMMKKLEKLFIIAESEEAALYKIVEPKPHGHLTKAERLKLACAKHFHVPQDQIEDATTAQDTKERATGIRVRLFLPNKMVNAWVDEQLK